MLRIVVLLVIGVVSCVANAGNHQAQNSHLKRHHYCTPSQDCWPSDLEWSNFASMLTGKLSKPKYPIAACFYQPMSVACAQQLKLIKNPFYLQSQPGALAWILHKLSSRGAK